MKDYRLKDIDTILKDICLNNGTSTVYEDENLTITAVSSIMFECVMFMTAQCKTKSSGVYIILEHMTVKDAESLSAFYDMVEAAIKKAEEFNLYE